MEIGILTYHKAHNYGAVLQLFGLYNYLESLGYSVKVIDYWPSYRDGQYNLVSKKYYLSSNNSIKEKFIQLIKDVVIFPEKFQKWMKFELFINNFRTISFNEINSPQKKLDFIFFGSDQIWRNNKFGFDEIYFGEFDTDAIKVSYAASMGIELLDVVAEEKFRLLIKNIEHISVRENSLAEKIINLGFPTVSQVLDPIFLLTKRQWVNYFPKIDRKFSNKYLLFYNLLNDNESKKIAKEICLINSWQFVEIQGDVKPFRVFQGIRTTTGPLEFLRLVMNAEFVVTSSFHGVAFSILFNKQFLASGFGANSSRVNSLLDLLSIKGRHIKGENYKDLSEINYEFINVRIDELKKAAEDFIDTSITYTA